MAKKSKGLLEQIQNPEQPYKPISKEESDKMKKVLTNIILSRPRIAIKFIE